MSTGENDHRTIAVEEHVASVSAATRREALLKLGGQPGLAVVLRIARIRTSGP